MDQTRLTVLAAITSKRALQAKYNGGVLKLAPHLLFERHGDLFISALNLSKAWQDSEELRLGQFKLAGLTEAELLEDGFEPLATFEPGPPRPEDILHLAVS